mgnify:CR=1 FL=1
MKLLKKIGFLAILLFTLLLAKDIVLASEYDFYIQQNTTLNYTTGNDFVDIRVKFVRKINNREYYFSAKGEQIFHIPDGAGKDEEEIKEEREYKKNSIVVTSSNGAKISYYIEELEIGNGMYVKVANYKETKYGSEYIVYLNYKVHDYVSNQKGLIKLEYPALDKETKLEQTDEETNTRTNISYNLDVIVDNDILQLAKIFPKEFEVKQEDENTTYSFDSDSRIGSPILLEFGTSIIYRFELLLETSKTDTIVPEKYSSNLQTISTNIYELSMPREFGENKQRVKIDKVSPIPTKISMDNEGNVIGTFEVPANSDSQIYISGYAWVEQPSYDDGINIPQLSYEEYLNSVKEDSTLSKYLDSSSYWQVTDPYIQNKAKELIEGKISILEIIQADYTFVGDTLTYDESMADSLSESDRKGAVAALESGTGVCMEYADALTALLRAQGIPSRVAFGYSMGAKDEYLDAGHAWVQAWIPEYGWLSIDPTYEGANLRIGPNIDILLWSTQYSDEDKRLRVFSANSVPQEPDNLQIKVYPQNEEKIENVESLLSYSDIQFENDEYSTKEMVNIVIKTTPLGKALIIILPITITLLLTILLLSLIGTLIRRLKTRKASLNQQP